MTLARRIGDDLEIGGVWCEVCQRDRYFSTKYNRCTWCKTPGDYQPRGLRVRVDGQLTDFSAE